MDELLKAFKAAIQGVHATITAITGETFVVLSWEEYRKLCEQEAKATKSPIEIEHQLSVEDKRVLEDILRGET